MISVCSESDLRSLLPLYDEVQALHAAVYPRRFRQSVDWEGVLDDMTAAHEAGHVFLVADGQNGPAGFLHYEVQDRPGTALKFPDRIGMVHVISVTRDRRRTGLGRSLLARAIEDFRAAGVARWAVSYWAFNMASKRLMESAGAEPCLVFAEAELLPRA